MKSFLFSERQTRLFKSKKPLTFLVKLQFYQFRCFFLLFLHFSLLDPVSGGKIIADPDP